MSLIGSGFYFIFWRGLLIPWKTRYQAIVFGQLRQTILKGPIKQLIDVDIGSGLLWREILSLTYFF